MKYVLMLSVLCLVQSVSAQPRQKLAISDVTMFLRGAQLISSAPVSLPKGESEVIFTNVARTVDAASIVINATNSVVVGAATFQYDDDVARPETIRSPRVQPITDSIARLAADTQAIHNKITVLQRQIDILTTDAGAGSPGRSVAEQAKLLDLITARMEGYLAQQDKEQAKMDALSERIDDLAKELDAVQRPAPPPQQQPTGRLLVKFYTTAVTTSSVTVSYVAPDAGWEPTYDIFADDVNSPIRLFYKANIHQHTGIPWSAVHLTLSTGNPNEGAQAPTPMPWYMALYIPPPPPALNMGGARTSGTQYNIDGVVVQAYKKPLVNVDNPGTHILSGSDISRMPTNDVSDLVSMSPGIYQSARGSSLNTILAVDNAGVNTSFDIDLPYTVPSDDKQHLVSIRESNLPATYRYYAIPRLDKDAFLQAQVTNWADLDLLPGPTNIFYEGTYIGHGNMDVRNLRDTMFISLGRDKKIIIKRDQDKKLRSVRTIGTNVHELFAYTITVRNTRRLPIDLTLQDQQPISTDNDVNISTTNGSATTNETTGILQWSLQVPPAGTQSVAFSYTVRYPKGRTITGLH